MIRTALKTMENNRSHMTYVIKLSRDMLYTISIHSCISWACSIIHNPRKPEKGIKYEYFQKMQTLKVTVLLLFFTISKNSTGPMSCPNRCIDSSTKKKKEKKIQIHIIQMMKLFH